MTEWIKVSERLPERTSFSRSVSVLAHCPENICSYTATYDLDKDQWEHFGGHGGNINKKVSHWQPLPQPPEDTDNA